MTANLEPAPARRGRATTAEVVQYHGLKPQDPMAYLMVLLADRYNLDPLLNHLEVIKTRSGPRLYITRDGYLDIAHRSGELNGIVLEDVSHGKTGWRATVSVWRKDHDYPYTYSAGCGDEEAQAEQGNGEAMAIARAERRALKRAFPVLVSMDNAFETASDNVEETAVLTQRAEPRGPRWTPSATDQRDSHKALAALDPEDQRAFLARYEIPQFSSPWPAAAVAEVLGFGPEAEPEVGG